MNAIPSAPLVAPDAPVSSLLLTHRARRRQRIATACGRGLLLAVTALSAWAVLFIFYFIAKDALPFFRLAGLREFFTSTRWYPSADHPEFGALAIFLGSGLVTLTAILVAAPVGIAAAICLSDILPFGVRQLAKPVIEMLAAIPSVAYGFFALVIMAPLWQERGGIVLAAMLWIVGAPLALVGITVLSNLAANLRPLARVPWARGTFTALLTAVALAGLLAASRAASRCHVASGTNALNAALILGLMALPTVVSVSEDALQAVGRELRAASYALGATRSETILRTVLPAAGSGIFAALILGLMRALGETMVVWMASGNAAQIPVPWYNLLEPVRTMTATIAGDMGEADHMTGSTRYHVLFALALCLVTISFLANITGEAILQRARRKLHP